MNAKKKSVDVTLNIREAHPPAPARDMEGPMTVAVTEIRDVQPVLHPRGAAIALEALTRRSITDQDRIHGLEWENLSLRGERDRYRNDYERACKTVAEMHAAAVGEIRGPDLDPVSDVQALKKRCDELAKKRRKR